MMADISNDINIVQLENYRQRLLSLRTAMQLAFDDEQSHQPSALEPSQRDGLSRVDSIMNQQRTVELKRSLQCKLTAIDGALIRLDNDEFGLCVICDNPISDARLNFDLTVTSCIECHDKAHD